LRIDPARERDQIDRVRAIRQKRNPKAALKALEKLQQAATTSDNLVPLILSCVEAYATVGEISYRLRKVWGEYRETSTV